MRNKTIITDTFIMLLVTFFSYFSLFFESSFEDHVNQAELIIKGHLIEKYVKKEVIINAHHKLEGNAMSADYSVLTTYVFAVDELLKGDYDKKFIEVKMFGGCEDQSDCDSNEYIYDFAKDENTVLLLKYVAKNNTYQMSHPGCSAFIVHENGLLVRKSIGETDNRKNKHEEFISYQFLNHNQHSLVSLKNIIDDLNMRNILK